MLLIYFLHFQCGKFKPIKDRKKLLILLLIINFILTFQNQRMPFDSKTPLGYFVTIFILYIFVLYVTRCNISAATFPIGTSFMLISLASDLKVDVRHFNEINIQKANPLEIIKLQLEIIRFHAEIKGYNLNIETAICKMQKLLIWIFIGIFLYYLDYSMIFRK